METELCPHKPFSLLIPTGGQHQGCMQGAGGPLAPPVALSQMWVDNQRQGLPQVYPCPSGVCEARSPD